MREMYDDKHFDDQSVECPKCGWQGRGDDAHVIDFYGVSKIKEVYCPNCDRYLCSLRSSSSPRGESSDQISFQIG